MTRALVIAMLLVPSLAGAEPQQAVSVPVYSLQQAQGIAVEYERFDVIPGPWSLTGGIGIRDAADGDYSSTATSASAEARYWFRKTQMRGWFVAGGFNLTWTTLTDEVDDRHVGSSLAIAETLQGGYRWVPWRTLEITPSLGLEYRTEVDLGGRLPGWSRGSLTTGLTVGWLF